MCTMCIPALLTLFRASPLSKTIANLCFKTSSLKLSNLLLAMGISTSLISITIALNKQKNTFKNWGQILVL